MANAPPVRVVLVLEGPDVDPPAVAGGVDEANPVAVNEAKDCVRDAMPAESVGSCVVPVAPGRLTAGMGL